MYIAMISIHGLVRGQDMELGRDADTGGQVKYVVELAREVIAADDEVDEIHRRMFGRLASHEGISAAD